MLFVKGCISIFWALMYAHICDGGKSEGFYLVYTNIVEKLAISKCILVTE